MGYEHIYKRHNKTLLLYHLVFPMKYRREVLTEDSGETLKSICLEISVRFEIEFVEIGYESNHVHFLIQSAPSLSVTQIVRVLKSITARELFRLHPELNINYGEVIYGQVVTMLTQLVSMETRKLSGNMLKIKEKKKSTKRYIQGS